TLPFSRRCPRLRAAQHLFKRLSDPRHLALGHLREEGQRERSRRDVLAYRELAGAVAEALAVVAHQVDGGEVRPARDTSLSQGTCGGVSLDAARQLDDEHEPSSAIAAGIRAWQFQALDRSQRVPIQ